ncbi:hypothetical protein DRO69_00195 [Candidatus Bathyarchaeota archaeon]|nr:MAG: hypothetical protein DRO69_00195 [Candidatus Bathyarchaeota archaeon]
MCNIDETKYDTKVRQYLRRSPRARAILLALEDGAKSITQLMKAGVQRPTAYRILKRLGELDVVERSANGLFRLKNKNIIGFVKELELQLPISSLKMSSIVRSLCNLHNEPLGDVSVSMTHDLNFFGRSDYSSLPVIAPLAQGIVASMFLSLQHVWPRKSLSDIASRFWKVDGRVIVELMIRRKLAKVEGIYLKSISDSPRFPLERGGHSIYQELSAKVNKGVVGEAIRCLIYDDCRRMLLTEEELVHKGIRVRDAKLSRRDISEVLKLMYNEGIIKKSTTDYLIPGRVLRLYGKEAEKAVNELGSLDTLALNIAKDVTYRPGTSAVQITERLKNQGLDANIKTVMDRLNELKRIGFATYVPIPGLPEERAGWITVWSPVFSEAKKLLTREDEKAMIEGLALNRAAAMAFLSFHWPELYKADIKPIKVLDYISKKREATLDEIVDAFAADKMGALQLGMLFSDLRTCGFIAYDPNDRIVRVREPKNFDLVIMTARKLDESPVYELEKVSKTMPKLDGWLDRAVDRLFTKGNGRLEGSE